MTQSQRPAEIGTAERRTARATSASIGLLFASVGSIIGSGWLFGALTASQLAGPAAIFSWVIAAVMIMLIGLVLRRTGHDVPGLRRRRPLPAPGLRFVRQLHDRLDHLGRGGHHRADRGRGRAAVRDQVRAVHHQAHRRRRAGAHADRARATLVAVLGDGVLRGRQLLRHPLVRPGQQRRRVVEARRHHAGHHRVPRRPRSTRRTSASHGFATDGAHGIFTAIATGGIVVLLPRLPAGHRAGRRDRQPQAQHPDRGHRLGAASPRCIYVLLQIAFIGAVGPATCQVARLGATSTSPTTSARWPPSRRSSGWAGWPRSCTSTRSSPRPTPG